MEELSPSTIKSPLQTAYLRSNSPQKAFFNHLEDLRELIEKSKEYLKINKNINCFYLLNRASKAIPDCEIADIHFLFQFYRNFLECINRILNRIFIKHPEKNDKQMLKIKNLMNKAWVTLEEWSEFILLYLKEFKQLHVKNKQNEKLLKEILENLNPIIINNRNLFNIKVFEEKKDDIHEIESPDIKKTVVKIEETMVMSMMKGSVKTIIRGKYRSLDYEEKIKFIKFGFYLNEFVYQYLEFCLIFAIWQKKKKNSQIAVKVLTKASDVMKNPDALKDQKVLAIYIRTQMFLATLLWEAGLVSETLLIYDDLNESFRKQFQSIQDKEFQYRKSNLLPKYKKKLQACIRKMALNLIYQSILYETNDKYEKSLECLKFSAWLSTSFLDPIDEIHVISTGFLTESQNKYQGILKEIGEISKVVQIYITRTTPEPQFFDTSEEKPILINPILEQSDTLLYNKFKRKTEFSDYIYVKSFSDQQQNLSDLTNMTNNNNNQTLLKLNKTLSRPQSTDKPKKTQDQMKLFDVSLEPTYQEQSHTSKRLSILGKKTRNENFLSDFSKEYISNREKKAKSFYSERQDNSNSIQTQRQILKKKLQKPEEFPNNSTILTTTKYFKTSEQIRRLIEEKHKKNSVNELDKTPIHIMHNLDDFFAKKINDVLLRKCRNRSIRDVQQTFSELQKDEDFDKKEFDFSKKMLTHKKSYSMGKIKSEFLINQEEKDKLDHSHPRKELRNEIKELFTQNNIKNKIDKTNIAKEDEKTINFSLKLCQRSSVMPFVGAAEDNAIVREKTIKKMNQSKEKLQNVIMKHRVTFEFKKMVDIQRKNSLMEKSENSQRKARSLSILKKVKNDENPQDYHKNTKEMIQKMAENIVKDLEKCDRKIEELKINGDVVEKQKNHKERESNAKKERIVKMNGDLSKSVKNIAMKKEMMENLQNQLFGSAATKRKPSNIINPISLMKYQ